MSNLTEEQLAHLKHLLDDREKELRADLQRELANKEEFTDVAPELPDPADLSFADLTADLGNAAITRDVVELRAIDAARKRMESGMYGDCVQCETEIPYARLEVQPTADRCAPCQDMYEKTHSDGIRGATL